jgi:Calcineurin-like phosphoesterase
MHAAVREADTVLDWMNGTRQLIQNNDPRFKAAAMQAFGKTTDAEWNELRATLLKRIDSSSIIARQHAHEVVDSKGSLTAEPFIPQDKVASVFQSAMDERITNRVTSSVLASAVGVSAPYGPPEKFDSGDGGWISVIAARLEEALGGKAPFVHSADMRSFRDDSLPAQARVALFADWATGEAPALALKAAIETRNPDYTIHLGDTYYAGFQNEIAHNLLASWPGGVTYGKSFALNGNHEMYCGGKPYFNSIPVLGQSASYFNLGNQFWRFIGLDTSWCELNGNAPATSWGKLNELQLPWLSAQISEARKQPQCRVILLTHHQLFSAFDGEQLGAVLRQQLQPQLDAGNIYAWFWGHEHRGIVYGPTKYNLKARCVGHGGFPYAPCTGSPKYVQQFPIKWREQRCEPTNAWYGMRGFALLTLDGPSMHVDYVDQTGALQYQEDWQ